MITVGLIKELYFIAKVLNHPMEMDLWPYGKQDNTIKVHITPEAKMIVWYDHELIWEETVEGDVSFFGVESCDTIARIIACIDNGTTWDQYRWKESLDRTPKVD